MTLGSTIQTIAAITTAIFSIGIYDQIKRLTPPQSREPDFVDKVRQAAASAASIAAAADQTKK